MEVLDEIEVKKREYELIFHRANVILHLLGTITMLSLHTKIRLCRLVSDTLVEAA